MAGFVREAHDQKLVLYAGAGVSVEAGLPLGGDLAERMADRFEAFGLTVPADMRRRLLAVADMWTGPMRDLQGIALACAPFKATDPTLSHACMALILAEGIAAVLSTNWDTCVERAAPPGESIATIVTNDDARTIRSAALQKVHGCALKPTTALLTSEQLSQTPVWAQSYVSSELSSATVIFVGISDVAPYIRIRLEKLIDDLGDVENVAVVWPHAISEWDGSQWGSIVGSLSDDRKFEATAEDFLLELLEAWVADAMAHVRLVASGQEDTALDTATRALTATFEATSPLDVLIWLRRAVANIATGESALVSQTTTNSLVALAKAVGTATQISLAEGEPLRSSDRFWDLCMTQHSRPGTEMVRRAREQVKRYRTSGRVPDDMRGIMILNGHVGALFPQGISDFAEDVLAEAEDGDLVDSPGDELLEIRSASQVLEESA